MYETWNTLWAKCSIHVTVLNTLCDQIHPSLTQSTAGDLSMNTKGDAAATVFATISPIDALRPPTVRVQNGP